MLSHTADSSQKNTMKNSTNSSIQHITILNYCNITHLICPVNTSLGKPGLCKEIVMYLLVWEQSERQYQSQPDSFLADHCPTGNDGIVLRHKTVPEAEHIVLNIVD